MNRYSKIKFEDMDVCMEDLLKISHETSPPLIFAQFFHTLQVPSRFLNEYVFGMKMYISGANHSSAFLTKRAVIG